MAKDPAFLFYSSDFLTGVSDLTIEERGQYITLLCLQHQKGHLSDKVIKIAVGVVSVDVLEKFTKDSEGLYFNERLELEAEKRKAHSEKQKQRALDGWKKRKANQTPLKATAYATALPLEDEDVNEDKGLSTINKGAYFPNQELNDLFSNWMKMCGEKGKPFAQSQIEALQMKLNYNTDEKSIAQVRQSLEKGWLNLRVVDEVESKVTAQEAEDINVSLLKHLKDVQSENDNNELAEHNRLRGVPKE